jgi:hypothetical protein
LSLLIFAFQASCSQNLSITTGFGKSISGEASMFKPSSSASTGIGSLALNCSSATATLHAINSDGSINENALASSPIDSEGKFKITLDKSAGVDFAKPNVGFVIQAEGCNAKYFRPLTEYAQQDITGASTLLTFTSDINDNSKTLLNSITRTDIKSAIDQINQATSSTSLATLLDAIIANPTLTQKFETLINVPPTKVKEIPPASLELTAPLQISEATPSTYNVVSHHWNPDYQVAFEWSLDGVVVSSTDTYNYTPTKNSQGTRHLTLKIGSQTSGGAFDGTKSYKTETFSLNVTDSHPAIAPTLTLTSPAGSIISTRSLVLAINTGAALINCETFSSLGLTEETLAPPASFPITCTSANSQALPYDLISSGDGSKTLRLWAKDAAGNVSLVASSLSLNLDTTPPTTSITSTTPAFSNNSTQTFTFSATDASAIASYQCQIDGGGFSPCTSPKSYSSLTQGAHTFSVTATDIVGLTSSVASVSWSIDLTSPVAAITATPAANTTQLSAQFSFSGTDSGGSSLAGFVCKMDSGAFAPCTSPIPYALTEGDHTFQVKAYDNAGNYSSIETFSWSIDTTAPVIALTSVPTSAQKGGNSTNLQFTVTEAHISTSQNFTVSYSTDNGATWNTSGTVASTAGPLSGTTFNYTLGFPSADIAQYRVKVSGVDLAGNTSTSAASNAFIVDNTAPTLSFISLNNGATVSLSPTLTALVNATDALSGVNLIRIADAVGSNCQASYADNNWQSFTNGSGPQSYSFITGFANGNHQVCAWAKDTAGNVSEITANSNAGTEGVDMAIIRLDQGSPPTFTSLSVTNANGASSDFGTTTFANGDAVNITFTVTDDTALATNPVSIYVTTDDNTYTEIASSSVLGSPGAGQTTWTKTHSGYSAPTGSYFKLRLVALDSNGNTSQVSSAALNTGKWSVFAGNGDIGDGSSALSAVLRFSSADGSREKVAVNSKNEIFIATLDGLRKIDPATGNISTYISFGTTAGIPGTISSTTRLTGVGNMVMDGDNLYVSDNNRLYRIDTKTNTIALYAGGGSSVANGVAPNSLLFWTSGSITIDSISKDIYFVNTCDASVTNSSSVTSYKIQKITQNSSTKAAATVQDVAGNCVKDSNIVDGNALATPLDGNLYRQAHGSLLYVSSIGALYFAPYGGPVVKIIGGNIYKSTSSTWPNSVRGGVYIPAQNKIYYARMGSGIYSFTPNSDAAFNETVSLAIRDEINCPSVSCRDDGVSLANAAVTSGSLFTIGGQLGVIDNTTNTSTVGRLRVVDINTDSLQTLAGSDRFSGNGQDRTLAHFGGITRLLYKTTNTTNFPMGLYAMDSGGLRILQMDPTESSIHIRAGNGISGYVLGTDTFGTTAFLGQSTSTSTLLSNFAVNPDGFFSFYSQNRIWNVKNDLSLEAYLNTGSTILNKADGFSGNSAILANGEHKSGLVYDGAGNLYFGGYQSTTSTPSAAGASKIMVRKSDGTFYTVIGNTTISASADCIVAGCAQAKSIAGSSGSDSAGAMLLGPYDKRYNSNEGRLLFAEGSAIRTINSAYNPAVSKLGTLTNQAGTAINFGRTVGSFVYTYVDGSSEQIDRIYYISSNNILYCYKASTGADASCNNSALGPPASINNTLSSSTIAIDPSGNVYVVNASTNVIYKYSP